MKTERVNWKRYREEQMHIKDALIPREETKLLLKYIKMLGNLATEENDGIPLPAYEVIMEAVRYSLKEELSEGQQAIYPHDTGKLL